MSPSFFHCVLKEIRRLTQLFRATAAGQNKKTKTMIKPTIALLTLAISVTGAFAGTQSKSFKETVVVADSCKFRDQELQLDVFTAGAFYEQGRPGWGGGLGINYFFNKFVGIGFEQDIVGREKSGGSKSYAEWSSIGNLFLRYPICSLNLAPYALVGGGGAYGSGKGYGFGHVGGGLEYRLTDNIGLFSDARYVYSGQEPRNAVLGRAGLRFAF